MRVLLINPEFPNSFWSLQESCKLLGRKALMAPLGLITLAALLPGDWEFRLADLNTRRLRPDDWDWAEMVMLSGMIVQSGWNDRPYPGGQSPAQNRGGRRPLCDLGAPRHPGGGSRFPGTGRE